MYVQPRENKLVIVRSQSDYSRTVKAAHFCLLLLHDVVAAYIDRAIRGAAAFEDFYIKKNAAEHIAPTAVRL